MSFVKIMSSLTLGVLLIAGSVLLSPPQATGLVSRRSTTTTPPQTAASSAIAGYGRNTVGGSGGRNVLVTNLKDSGLGSLRHALEAAGGRRIVRFRVHGTIALQSPIKIKNPYITVKGGTAPGDGIQVRGNAIIVVTHDVILKNLRIRPGDAMLSSIQARDVDALTLNGVGKNVYNVVLDHLSLLWGPDIGGLAMLGNVHNVTVQYSIMGEGLYHSRHPEGGLGGDGHSTAVNVMPYKFAAAPQKITFYRNLITTSDTRNPRLQGVSCVDLVNNVIYNWGDLAASGNPHSLNIVNNWFRAGPRMKTRYWYRPQTSSAVPSKIRDGVFTDGNRSDGFRGRRAPDTVQYAATPRCGGYSKRPWPVRGVFFSVMTNVGARLPVLDSVDRRVISNVRHRTGPFFNGINYAAPHPYWPLLAG